MKGVHEDVGHWPFLYRELRGLHPRKLPPDRIRPTESASSVSRRHVLTRHFGVSADGLTSGEQSELISSLRQAQMQGVAA
jgi:hypothetical protein